MIKAYILGQEELKYYKNKKIMWTYIELMNPH